MFYYVNTSLGNDGIHHHTESRALFSHLTRLSSSVQLMEKLCKYNSLAELVGSRYVHAESLEIESSLGLVTFCLFVFAKMSSLPSLFEVEKLSVTYTNGYYTHIHG